MTVVVRYAPRTLQKAAASLRERHRGFSLCAGLFYIRLTCMLQYSSFGGVDVVTCPRTAPNVSRSGDVEEISLRRCSLLCS